jgi:hypothetical protein
MSSSSVPNAAETAPLVDQRSESATFTRPASLLPDIGAFVERVAAGWELDHLGLVGASAAVELAVWLQNHEPSPAVRVNLTWAAPLLQIEVFDQGPDVPHTGASVHDAAMAVRLLVQPGVQWGASLDARGRCLWATVDAAPYENLTLVGASEAGP